MTMDVEGVLNRIAAFSLNYLNSQAPYPTRAYTFTYSRYSSLVLASTPQHRVHWCGDDYQQKTVKGKARYLLTKQKY